MACLRGFKGPIAVADVAYGKRKKKAYPVTRYRTKASVEVKSD